MPPQLDWHEQLVSTQQVVGSNPSGGTCNFVVGVDWTPWLWHNFGRFFTSGVMGNHGDIGVLGLGGKEEAIMKAVLLLNATYEPLRAIPLNRAVCLLVAAKAEMVQEGVGFIRSRSMQMPMPAVIRLRYYVRVPYKTQIKLTKPALMARDKHRCQYCGDKATTVDHVIPRSRGGRHVWNNVVAACQSCNSRKDNHTLAEIGWTLHTKPVVPRGTRWVVIGVATIDPTWRPFLVGPNEIAAASA